MANFKRIGDIDIDTNDRKKILDIINHTPASIIKNNKIDKHNTGIYVQKVPVDLISGLCSLDYNTAEDLGYFKIDVLNSSAYKDIKDENHLNYILSKDPNWDLLDHKEIVENLYHIKDHFDIIQKTKPRSVEQLAMVLAMIRPAKRHLVGKSWDIIEKDVWVKSEKDVYAFKKSHATGYALLIVMQMNLMMENCDE